MRASGRRESEYPVMYKRPNPQSLIPIQPDYRRHELPTTVLLSATEV